MEAARKTNFEKRFNPGFCASIGTFGGLATKLLWAHFGLLLTGLAATGAVIYAKRTRQVLDAGIALPSLDFLGWAKWPSLALASAVPAIAFRFWQDSEARAPGQCMVGWVTGAPSRPRASATPSVISTGTSTTLSTTLAITWPIMSSPIGNSP